jgi:predicted phosphohydrolase
MKILLGSDLHLEFNNQQKLPDFPEYDIAILAGDIGIGTQGVAWALDTLPNNKPIIYIPGNHEYYNHDFHEVNMYLAAWDKANERLHVLNAGTFEYEDVVFIGGTLWTDFKLPNYHDYPLDAYKRAISDFHVIKNSDHSSHKKFTPEDAIHLHVGQKQYIAEELDKHVDKKRVVATHFLPSMDCIIPFYQGNNLNPYFCNDLDQIINDKAPNAWLYGHTHAPLDKLHSNGKTRLVCNPRGYPKEAEDKASFRKEYYKWKVIEI